MDNTIVGLLKDLIMEHNRVSLPCLGSFTSEYSPSYIVDGIIYPPSKSIVFYQNEILNDEKLEKRLARYNRESIGVAKEKIAFWIDNICVLLATGEDVFLPGLGKLYVSNQSKLMFEQSSENMLLDSYGLFPVEIRPVNRLTYKPPIQKRKSDISGRRLFVILALFLLAATAIIIALQLYKSRLGLGG
ncbi:MAG: hypothetical protein LBD35_06915 [Prevotellaceae bacterium]|jgi:nucleoid DNA-binding protein|nr:hypothetical protein [Prevotellaceae bacterium]